MPSSQRPQKLSILKELKGFFIFIFIFNFPKATEMIKLFPLSKVLKVLEMNIYYSDC